jgi:hypothetical protein
MSSAADAGLLNDHQRRHLGVTLGRIQRLIRELEAMLDSPPRRDGMELDVDDIPPEVRLRAIPTLEDLNARIDELADRFDLPRRESSRFRWVRAVLGVSIDHLEDSRSTALRAFGAVHPALARALDPSLKALQERLNALLSLLHAGGRQP